MAKFCSKVARALSLADSGTRRSAVAMRPTAASSFQCEEVFDRLAVLIEKDGPAMVRKTKGSFVCKITSSDGQVQEWLVDLKTAPGYVAKERGLKGNCTFSMKDSDFMDLINGKLGLRVALMTTKLKMSGDKKLARKLISVVPKLKGKLS